MFLLKQANPSRSGIDIAFGKSTTQYVKPLSFAAFKLRSCFFAPFNTFGWGPKDCFLNKTTDSNSLRITKTPPRGVFLFDLSWYAFNKNNTWNTTPRYSLLGPNSSLLSWSCPAEKPFHQRRWPFWVLDLLACLLVRQHWRRVCEITWFFVAVWKQKSWEEGNHQAANF